jgi:hypothetical protein
MAKYLIMVNDILKEFETHIVNYYEGLISELLKNKNDGCKFQFGSKWIKVFDSNKSDCMMHKPPSLKDFIEYAKTKGVRFKKKINP